MTLSLSLSLSHALALAEAALVDDAKATPGPWKQQVWIETDGDEWRATGPGHDSEASDHGSEPGGPDEQAAQADAAWLAAARSREPQLAAIVKALVPVVEAARAWRVGRERDRVGTAPPGGQRSATGVALIDAVDALDKEQP